MPSLKLVWRNLTRRPMRSLLTILSLAIAIFLICGLRTLVTTINAGVEAADSRRLAVMSATGLFVELPMRYQQRIDQWNIRLAKKKDALLLKFYRLEETLGKLQTSISAVTGSDAAPASIAL